MQRLTSQHPMNKTRSTVLYGLILLAVIFILNSVELNSYFIRDDLPFIRATYDKEPGYFAKLFFRDSAKEVFPILGGAWKGKGFIRPILHLSFKIDYLLYGTNPTGYHITNLTFHFLNTILVFLIINFITKGANKFLGFAGALLFAVHPAHSQALAWVVGRGEVIMAFFYLLSFYLFMRYRSERRRRYYGFSVLCFFLALFTKETAVTLPVLLISYDLLREHLPWPEYRELGYPDSSKLEDVFQRLLSLRETAAKYVSNWMPYLVILLIYFLIRRIILGTFIGGYGGRTGFDIKNKILVFVEYLRYAFLASAFNPENFIANFTAGYRYGQGYLNLAEIAITIFYVVFVLFLFIKSKTIRWPLFIFSVLWIVISYIIVFFNIYIAPLLLYLPMVGIACLLVALIFSLPTKEASLSGLAFLVIFYAAHQFKYNSDYAEAGRISKQIKETIETASQSFRRGDLIIIVDLPRTHRTAWVLWNGLPSALQRPFTESDIFDAFRIRLYYYPEIKIVIEELMHKDIHSLRWDEIKSALEVAPLLHQDMLELSEDAPDVFKKHYGRGVHLFVWHENTTKLEKLSSLEFAQWIKTRSEEAAQNRYKYIRWLRSRDWILRSKAVQALGGLRNKQDTDILIAALKDQEEEVRVQAARALAGLGGEKAVDALIQALKDESEKVRAQAASSLGELKDLNAVQALMDAVKDKSANVRSRAAWALGVLNDPRALDVLIPAAKDENESVRMHVLQALGTIKDSRALDVLIEATTDEEEIVRAEAAWALGQLKDSRSVGAVIRCVKDKQAHVRLWATWALGHFNDPRAVAILSEAIRDEDKTVRVRAAQVLGQLKDPRAVDALIQAAWDENEVVRAQALWGLGQLNDPKAFGTLLYTLRDKNGFVRAEAAWALGQFNDVRAVDALIQALEDKESYVRVQAASALGKLNDKRAVEPLIYATRDKDAEVRLLSIWALGAIKDQKAIDALIQTTQDENEVVRVQAAWALGLLKNPKSLEALIRSVQDKNDDVRIWSVWALGELKDVRAIDVLSRASQDKNETVRARALGALNNLKDSKALDGVGQPTETKDGVRK